MFSETLLQNAIEHDGVFYKSAHRHDYVEIKGLGFIDGGSDYIRTSFYIGPDSPKNYCLSMENTDEQIFEKWLVSVGKGYDLFKNLSFEDQEAYLDKLDQESPKGLRIFKALSKYAKTS